MDYRRLTLPCRVRFSRCQIAPCEAEACSRSHLRSTPSSCTSKRVLLGSPQNNPPSTLLFKGIFYLMSRSRDFREPRRRGFGDDFMSEPPRSMPDMSRGPSSFGRPAAGPEIEATVKWFNPEKGFGFVELSDGSGDAFLHIRAVEAAGHSD